MPNRRHSPVLAIRKLLLESIGPCITNFIDRIQSNAKSPNRLTVDIISGPESIVTSCALDNVLSTLPEQFGMGTVIISVAAKHTTWPLISEETKLTIIVLTRSEVLETSDFALVLAHYALACLETAPTSRVALLLFTVGPPSITEQRLQNALCRAAGQLQRVPKHSIFVSSLTLKITIADDIVDLLLAHDIILAPDSLEALGNAMSAELLDFSASLHQSLGLYTLQAPSGLIPFFRLITTLYKCMTSDLVSQEPQSTFCAFFCHITRETLADWLPAKLLARTLTSMPSAKLIALGQSILDAVDAYLKYNHEAPLREEICSISRRLQLTRKNPKNSLTKQARDSLSVYIFNTKSGGVLGIVIRAFNRWTHSCRDACLTVDLVREAPRTRMLQAVRKYGQGTLAEKVWAIIVEQDIDRISVNGLFLLLMKHYSESMGAFLDDQEMLINEFISFVNLLVQVHVGQLTTRSGQLYLEIRA
ncbi:hypothetical protein GMRT_10401 [Giardia muris]|uniref:Uncharacterized protein n=1 Tax=Giardia muris TaxID=5742 RepID=A0A4Z1SQ10_GIAMU|nr:hypothetical protein GMRT_10401 [Giardia muris]|eukprot:TNJ27750.1 hypothetical protein GMRT_10401 [Giardia muris]